MLCQFIYATTVYSSSLARAILIVTIIRNNPELHKQLISDPELSNRRSGSLSHSFTMTRNYLNRRSVSFNYVIIAMARLNS